jgi:CubicO group peptidase (beta-lactamase class C family)
MTTKIARFSISLAIGSEALGLGTFEDSLTQLVEQSQLPGVAAGIVKNQKLIWARAIGYADIANKIPDSPTTLYRLASTSKPFAAVLIMQLAERGKLTLDTPMAKFRVPPRHREKPTLVRQVLSHTSEWTLVRSSSNLTQSLEAFLLSVLISHRKSALLI